MKSFFNYFNMLGMHWVPRALAACIALFILIQIVFVGIQSQIAEKAEIAGRSVINGSNTSLNPYYFSQAISGLELGALLSCVEIRKIGHSIPFYESTPEYCEEKYSHSFLLNGEVRKAAVRSANGEEWELKFRAVNGPLFYIALWAFRISALFFTIIFFLWAEWRVKTAKRLQEVHARAAMELAQFATQVAHDIRSPLATLNILTSSSTSNPEESRSLLQGVIQRINDIANSLLEKEKSQAKEKDSTLEDMPISSILRQVTEEKKIEFQGNKNLSISLEIHTNDTFFVRGRIADFSRALSNLINNSAEAINSRPGKISVALQANQEKLSIRIIDDGPGIPTALLGKVGARGFSFGKAEGGSGLGIFQAKSVISDMGGDLSLISSPKGTEALILLPFTSISPCGIVLLDDDTSLHIAWQLAARARNMPIRCFGTVADLQANLHLIPKTASFYIDSLLEKENLKGEEVAKDIYEKGYKNLFLCTGLSASNFQKQKMPWIKEILSKEPPWL